MNASKPSIETVEAAYAAGDYLTARRFARALAQDPDSPPSTKRRANEVIAATGIDKWALGAFLLTAGVLGYLIIRYVL